MNKFLRQQIDTFFNRQYNVAPEKLVIAPGRINLIGEHTDYNNGFVFPAAIDKCMCFGFKKNNSSTVRLHALNLNESIELDIETLNRSKYSWANYLIGNLVQLQKLGHSIEGFDCAFVSDIPIGAGLSSSSALECGFSYGLNELFNLKLSKWELIDCSQKSNHDFLGVKGGYMDQFACLFGKQNHAMLLDCQHRSFEYFPLNMNDYQWVLINSMVEHDHVTSAYNDRVAACQAVINYIQKINKNIKSLRDVTQHQLSFIRPKISEFEFNCAQFILEENQRVQDFSHALKQGDFHKMGELLNASHCGLQQKYKVSCSELDMLVELALRYESVLGSRMMGGGFGGCTLNLIEKPNADEIIKNIIHDYCLQTGIQAQAYTVDVVDGCTAS